jgi:hypothetical protein
MQLGTALHGVLVAHIVCPEHGELTHADAGHATRGVHAREGHRAALGEAGASGLEAAHDRELAHARGNWPEEDRGPEPEATAPEEDEHSHDHCLAHLTRGAPAAGERATRVIPAKPVVEAAPLLLVTVVDAESPSVARSRRLLEAPKSSPPRTTVTPV